MIIRALVSQKFTLRTHTFSKLHIKSGFDATAVFWFFALCFGHILSTKQKEQIIISIYFLGVETCCNHCLWRVLQPFWSQILCEVHQFLGEDTYFVVKKKPLSELGTFLQSIVFFEFSISSDSRFLRSTWIFFLRRYLWKNLARRIKVF